MRYFRFGLVAFTLFVLGAGQATAGVLYTQPSNFGSPTANAVASQNDPAQGGKFAIAYDNFTLGSAGTVANVQWQGLYTNPPVQGSITGFEITFWSNNPAGGGQPGAPLFTQHTAGTAGETFVGLEAGIYPTYNYSLDLTTGFAAAAGTEYWLSIVPDLTFPPQWGWLSGTGGDGRSVQDFLGTRNFINNDDAFSLNDTPQTVPEPATLTLLGLGIAGMAAYGWGRRKRRGA